jgi:hypothetical protein
VVLAVGVEGGEVDEVGVEGAEGDAHLIIINNNSIIIIQ